MINGNRVRLARELRGLTQTELGRRVGLAQPSIAQVEAGLFEPSDRVLKLIALQTGFPPAFFRRTEDAEFPMGSLLFRSHVSASARLRTQAYQHARIIYQVIIGLARRVPLLPIGLPRLSEEPGAAAAIARSALGFSPETPIKNLIRALERAGVLVIALPTEIEDGIDAFSAWVGDDTKRPVIGVVPDRPGDRLRLSVAHEVGHLVLHSTPRPPGKELEAEAFGFGAELLMPEAAMRAELVPPLTLTHLSMLKARWGVAIAALIRRARDLAIISPRQYSYLFEQLGAKGWRTREPVPIPVEKPRALRKMAELVYGLPIDYRRMANDFDLPVGMVRDILENYADRGNGLERATRGSRPKVLPLRSSEGDRTGRD
ncbi:MAG TPA: XRE family transcriptional regulator [Thermodesulfobacteriota bacterium]